MTYLTTLEFHENVIPELILARLCMNKSGYLDLRGICILFVCFFEPTCAYAHFLGGHIGRRSIVGADLPGGHKGH